MHTETDPDSLDAFNQVVQEHFEHYEQEAASDLIRDAFSLLPWELQELYSDYLALYRKGEREQAGELFEMWMDRARELGLI